MTKTRVQRVLGIMSGTSFDGVDYAFCQINSSNIKLLKLYSVKYPEKLKTQIYKAATNTLPSYELAQLHFDLGRFYAANAPSVNCDYIALHGQTVFHNPQQPKSATLQIGEPSYLAKKFNKPVVTQFRNMDQAFGGQGAPLATLFHKTVFSEKGKNVAVNNLGGISNVTYLPKAGRVLSFDTGPANILIDGAVRVLTKSKKRYDKDGELASRGVAIPSLVTQWLKHPYFSKKPPKSTGREDFNKVFLKKVLRDCRRRKLDLYSTVATLTEFTAQSIVDSYYRFFVNTPDKVILCGGGAENVILKEAIQQALNHKFLNQKVEVVTSSDLGWPTQAIEAAAFALLAYQTMNHKSGNLSSTTGAKCNVVLGQITPAPL